MAKAAIFQAIEAQRAAVNRNEAAVLSQLAKNWAPSYKYLQKQVAALTKTIRAKINAGELVQPEYVYSLERYQTMMEQASKSIREYNRAANQVITGAQADAVEIGSANGRQLVSIAAPDNPMWTRVNKRETRIMSGMLSEASPLSRLLNESFSQTRAKIDQVLYTGIATGQGSAWIAHQLEEAGQIQLKRALTIARTEVNRTYRTAHVEAMRSTKVTRGYRRMCYPPTACFACLMLDGEFYPIDADPCDHPNGKCSFVPVTEHFDPINEPGWQLGSEWFMEQDEDTQRKLMGKGRFDLWQSEQVNLRDMVYIKENPIWGGSPTIKTLEQLKSSIWAVADISENRKIALPLGKSVRDEIIENGLKRLNFTHHLDKMGAYAENMDSFEDYQDVIIHGNRFGFCFQDANNPDLEDSSKPFRQDDVTINELVSFLQKSEAYKGGKIRLISCEAGGIGGFAAQALADELEVGVLAPTETLYIDINGNYKIQSENGINGKWKLFEPNNRPK